MTNSDYTQVSAEDLTADHIGETVVLRGTTSDERLEGILVELDFGTERRDLVNKQLNLGNITVTLGILFRAQVFSITVGPNAVVYVK